MGNTRSARCLALEDLRLCQDPQKICEMLELLGYSAKVGLLATDALGFSSAERENIRYAYLLVDYGEFQILLFEMNELHSAHLRALAKSFLQRAGNYLLMATRDYKTVIFVHPRRLLDEKARLKVKIHKLVLDTTNPTRHDLEILEGLAAEGLSPVLYKLHFAEVFAEKGGFDIVIANPPYVRQERLDEP